MRIIDISMTLSDGMLTYEGDPKVKVRKVETFSKHGVTVSKITMGLHSGTHVDAPSHFLKDGKPVDKISLESLIGRARVCDLTSATDSITKSDLTRFKPGRGEIILLKTRNSNLLEKRKFSRKFVHLSEDAADYLVERKVKAVGIDYLSIEKFKSKDHYIHKRLLSSGILIIEGLDLKHVKAGAYTLYCLPLKIQGAEASPARCFLSR